jgi:hypothetical protein
VVSMPDLGFLDCWGPCLPVDIEGGGDRDPAMGGGPAGAPIEPQPVGSRREAAGASHRRI